MLLGILGFLAPTLLQSAVPALATPASAVVVRAESDTTATPLTVEIASLSPTAIPASGPVVVTGTVTNSDTTAWQDVALYPFIGFHPITTEAELTDAVATPETAEVGQRITLEGDYTKIGQLEPGQTVSFSLRVPRRHLTQLGVTASGVYWFGVHALGSGPHGFDNVADGRARTFLPLLDKNANSVTATVIVPIRGAVAYTADGAVADTDRWLTLLRPGGRLARLAELAAAPGGHDVSWLVDPAVLGAVKRLADGNPTRPLEVETDPSGGASGSPSATPSATASAASARSADTVDPATELTGLATHWWTQMLAALQGSDVLALPYGDLDLAAAASHNPAIYTSARDLSTSTLKEWGIPFTPVNAPVAGQLDESTASMLAERDPASTVLVSDAILPDDATTTQIRTGSLHLVAFDSASSAGGPAPTEALGGTALRQRILAEAALRSLTSSSDPLVVELPSRWSVADARELGAGLRQPWLGLHSLTTTMTGAPSTDVAADHLHPDAGANAKAISGRTFRAASDLIRSGRTLQRVLTGNKHVATATLAEALTTLSYQERGTTSNAAVDARFTISAMLAKIAIKAPRAVTLSGSSGRFAATISNDLNLPVTVSLKPMTDAGISIDTPKAVDVAPGTSATILLQASGARVGVHDVELVLMDSAGTRLSAPVSVPVRAAQVSKIIWVFLAVGCGLLFGAIGSRLVRRFRKGARSE